MKLPGLILIVLSMLYVNSVCAAHSDKRFHKTMKQTQQQAKFVRKLIKVSSAAQKVKASEDINVQSLYRAANDLYQYALVYIDDGNSDAASESLSYAANVMFRAVKLAGKQKVAEDNNHRIFELRLKSVNALLKALQRIGKIKGVEEKIDRLKSTVDTEINTAKTLMKAGKAVGARKVIDKAYVEIKTAISGLRSGDTLVRSLHFATKKDEYLYEIDRNNTHKMLVTLLLGDKMKDPRIRARAQKFLDKAAALRKKAEDYAKNGDYEKAVKTCEESTKQVIRAIRSSGFFIPG